MSHSHENVVFLAASLERKLKRIFVLPRMKKMKMAYNGHSFTTLLAATGQGIVRAWTSESRRPMSRYERVELQALIFYVSKMTGIEEATLSRELETKFGVGSVQEIASGHFADARYHLQTKLPS